MRRIQNLFSISGESAPYIVSSFLPRIPFHCIRGYKHLTPPESPVQMKTVTASFPFFFFLLFNEAIFHADDAVALCRKTLVVSHNDKGLLKLVAQGKEQFMQVFAVFGIEVS